MGKFQDLRVWQRAKELALYLYKITDQGAFSRDFALRDQIRRAAVSIPSNIAEGDELDTNRQAIRFFYIAKGSSAEVLTQTMIAHELDYITEEVFNHIHKECKAVSSMLSKLIKARSAEKN